MKKFIAMYVDISDSSDLRPRILGIFDNRETAVSEIHADIDTFCEANDIEPKSSMYDTLSASDEYDNISCKWNIGEVEI